MKATNSTNSTKETKATTTKSNLLYVFARLSEVTCKKANLTKANLTKVTKANLTKAHLLSIDSNPTGYRNYSPKIRQQVISNKLLNSQLYELYIVRKILS